MQNQQLYEKHRDMMQAILKLLDREVIGLPREEIPYIFLGEESNATGRVFIISFCSVVKSIENQIRELPEFGSCLKALESDREVSADVKESTPELLLELVVRTLPGKSITEPDLKTFLKKVAEAREKLFDFDENIFNKQYEKFEQAIYSGNTWIAFAPLYGYESTCDSVNLDGISIKKLARDEKTDLWYNHHDLLTMVTHEHEFIFYKYCLWVEQKTHAGPVPLFDSVVESLRLWKAGSVGYGDIYTLPIWGHGGGGSALRARVVRIDPDLTLEQKEVDDFKIFHRELLIMKSKSNELDIALRRFNDSYERRNPEDRLIDLLIAFESIFCDGEGELTHKLSTRVARLLEQDPQKRERLRDNIKEAYKERSRIVHGKKRIHSRSFWLDDKKTNLKPNEYVPLIEGYLRQCLRLLIDRTRRGGEKINIKKLLTEIDLG